MHKLHIIISVFNGLILMLFISVILRRASGFFICKVNITKSEQNKFIFIDIYINNLGHMTPHILLNVAVIGLQLCQQSSQ